MTIDQEITSETHPPIFSNSFFYSNLRIQECLASIRHAVEARRGLILITGAPGLGKTKILRKCLSEMPAHICCVAVSGKSLEFAEVLERLAAENSQELSGGEPERVRQCQTFLRARLERSELTALAVDDAHLLPERTLRNLLHNFLGGSAEAPDGALLQLMLAGNGSFRQKLAQAALLPLRRRPPVVCEAQPLSSQEVRTFVASGLRSAQRPVDLFDDRAVKRIALASAGNPRLIERLCEHALQLGDRTDSVTAERIDAAARALGIGTLAGETMGGAAAADAFTLCADETDAWEDENDTRNEPQWTASAPPPSMDARHESTLHPRRLNWLPCSARLGSWVRIFSLATLMIALGALIPTERAANLLAGWRAKWTQFMGNEPAKMSEAPPTQPVREQVSPPLPWTASTVRGPDRPMAGEPDVPRDDAPPESRVTQERPVNNRARSSAELPAQSDEARRVPLKDGPNGERNLQLEVAKAIASRAIMGVQVSVVQGTAILDGRVASERQRRAAERAALSVSGVERVRNRIAITFG